MPEQTGEHANPKKWLIFPLEIVERELSGKLLICDEALRRGWGCIIGTKQAVRESLDHLPPGVVFLKSIIISELNYMQMFREKGHKLACLDEEGLIQNNLPHMVSVRATAQTLAALDSFLLWGTVQRNAFAEKYPDQSGKFHVAGNPRADLWGKEKYRALEEEAVQSLTKEYGDYFIIPTSFGQHNHFMGKGGALSIYKVDKMLTQEYYDFQVAYGAYVKNIYKGFIDLIDPLSREFPDMNIIIRPHPSENRKPWDELAKKYKNVHVVFSGNVTPWLLAAKAIIHCGSTTAVEGHLLGRPVISYCRGHSDPTYDLEVPAHASVNVTKAEDVFKILHDIIDGKDINAHYPEIAEGHEWLKGWIDNMDSYESAYRIMDILDGLSVTPASYDAVPIPVEERSSFKEAIWSALRPLEFIPVIKDILPFRISQGLRSRRYGKSKTKDIDASFAQDYLSGLATLNDGKNADIKLLRKNLVVIE
ncbi:MAG: hypothetical protein CO093_04395 [Alphaproteobacteria bacterium CG_4_9_14_3_um_filter_47_13]|nr:MAG: hypothetical protein CO093_04395 [Alphaproteobacteria bacterium CG_4_9_14_3_um_filter_47_13]